MLLLLDFEPMMSMLVLLLLHLLPPSPLMSYVVAVVAAAAAAADVAAAARTVDSGLCCRCREDSGLLTLSSAIKKTSIIYFP